MADQVMALYNNPAKAKTAIEALGASGVSADRISVLVGEEFREEFFGPANSSQMVAGAATGGVVGGGLGAVLSGILAAGSLTVPFAGVLLAGPLVAALAGAGAGATAGGLLGALIGLGMPEDQAKQYQEAISESGGILLGVNVTNEDRMDVVKLLEGAGGAAIFGAV